MTANGERRLGRTAPGVVTALLTFLCAATPAQADWLSPTALSDPGEDASTPQITVNAAGDALAVWYRSDGTVNRVQAAVGTGPGGFGGAETLSDPGQDALAPRAAVDPAGNALVAW